jgi:hypothetical protein
MFIERLTRKRKTNGIRKVLDQALNNVDGEVIYNHCFCYIFQEEDDRHSIQISIKMTAGHEFTWNSRCV